MADKFNASCWHIWSNKQTKTSDVISGTPQQKVYHLRMFLDIVVVANSSMTTHEDVNDDWSGSGLPCYQFPPKMARIYGTMKDLS